MKPVLNSIDIGGDHKWTSSCNERFLAHANMTKVIQGIDTPRRKGHVNMHDDHACVKSTSMHTTPCYAILIHFTLLRLLIFGLPWDCRKFGQLSLCQRQFGTSVSQSDLSLPRAIF